MILMKTRSSHSPYIRFFFGALRTLYNIYLPHIRRNSKRKNSTTNQNTILAGRCRCLLRTLLYMHNILSQKKETEYFFVVDVLLKLWESKKFFQKGTNEHNNNILKARIVSDLAFFVMIMIIARTE